MYLIKLSLLGGRL